MAFGDDRMTFPRKPAIVLLLSVLSILAPVTMRGQAAAGKRTLVRAGHVLDVKTGKLSEAQTIVVVGDTI